MSALVARAKQLPKGPEEQDQDSRILIPLSVSMCFDVNVLDAPVSGEFNSALTPPQDSETPCGEGSRATVLTLAARSTEHVFYSWRTPLADCQALLPAARPAARPVGPSAICQAPPPPARLAASESQHAADGRDDEGGPLLCSGLRKAQGQQQRSQRRIPPMTAWSRRRNTEGRCSRARPSRHPDRHRLYQTA